MTALPASPLVSIVVRSMGRPELAQALGAIARQEHAPIEVIVVDATGGHHPPLPAIDWREGHRIRFLQGERRLTRPLAAQAGLDAVTGAWFTFLDDDDSCDPSHLSSLVAAARAHPDAVLVYGRGRELDVQGRLVRMFGRPFNRALMHYSPLMFWQAALISTRVRELGARFDPMLEVCEDRDFLAQVAALGRFAFVPGLASFGFRPDAGTSGTGLGANRDPIRMARFETLLRARWAGAGTWHQERIASRCARGIQAFREGALEAAKRAFLAVLDEYPGDPNALHALARVALARGDPRSAIGYVEAALDVNPFPSEYRATLAEARARVEPPVRKAPRLPVGAAGAPSRNAPCPCGSGRRYKACCGSEERVASTSGPARAAGPGEPPVAGTAQDGVLALAAECVRRAEASRGLRALQAACASMPTRERMLAAARLALALDEVEAAQAALAPLALGGAGPDAELDQLLQACGDRQHEAIAAASLWRWAYDRSAPVGPPAAAASPGTLVVDAEGPDPGQELPEPARVLVRMRAADPSALVRCLARVRDRWPRAALAFTRPSIALPAEGSPMPVIYPDIDPTLLELEPPCGTGRIVVGRPGVAEPGEEHPDDGVLLRDLLADGHALAMPRSAFLEQAFAEDDPLRRPRWVDAIDATVGMAGIDVALFRSAPGCRGRMDARILAAMAAARPVVVFADTLAAREWIEDGVSGFVVTTAPEARDRIAALAASAEIRARFGLAARAFVRRLHEAQGVAAAIAA